MAMKLTAGVIKVLLACALLWFVRRFLIRLDVESPRRAHMSAMRSDLRNLVTWQEAFRADSGRYAGRADVPDSVWTGGEQVIAFAATDDGWLAVVRHERAKAQCAIFVGPVDPPAPARFESEARCRSDLYYRLLGR